MKKKILVLALIIIIIIVFLLILYPVIKNNHYEKKLMNNVIRETNIKNIIYLNKDNNYYIIKTEDKVLVLDLNYEEIYSININELAGSKLNLTYRRNSLYYQEKVREKNKLTYKFYDIKTKELVYETVIGGA